MNIIGEHTDYSGLPVLPFAIDASLDIIFFPSKDKKVSIYSLNLPEESHAEFEVSDEIPPSPKGHWANYVKAAVQDGARYAREKGISPDCLKGFTGIVSGNIPQNAGLSSSSALVVACETAFFKIQGWEVSAVEMSGRTARAEHYVGTMGGGMDQTTSLCGKKGCCLKIYFHPLEIETVPINIDCCFLIASSMVDAKKSGGVKNHYNQRALECRLIKEAVSATFLKEKIIEKPLDFLGDLRKISLDKKDILNFKNLALETLKDDFYSLDDIRRICGEERFQKHIVGRFGAILKDMPQRFPLHKRVSYLFDEWLRVIEAAEYLKDGKLMELGALLYKTHEGMKRLFEASHPIVDKIISLAYEFGLPGARIVGAGFGGSTIHLVPKPALSDYKNFLITRFYANKIPQKDYDKVLRLFTPEDGVCIREIKID